MTAAFAWPLPDTLSGCRMVVPQTGGVLDFRAPASMVALPDGGQAFWHYYPDEAQPLLRGELVVRPVGVSVAGNGCLVRHRIHKVGEVPLDNAVAHLILDQGTIEPCTNVWGQTFQPPREALIPAVLMCQLPAGWP
jgi:hypothetical protein